MRVIRTELEGKPLIGVLIEHLEEEKALREMSGMASEGALNEFMRDSHLANLANKFLILLLGVISK